ncbi:MAG: lactoylglutathione lyase [Actinomycetota bacterium]|jgi:catechol 2,3-dioxygenase-like lactoylglutathione lyase family enzyme
MTVVNHVGLAVTDLARSRRFYEELLGFTFKNELEVPDGASTRMFDLKVPVGMRAAYLERDGWVLELLVFDESAAGPRRDRPITEPGLTHISLSVDDVDATCARVVELGGELLPDQSFPGMVALIRDPDGQLIELLPMAYRDTL